MDNANETNSTIIIFIIALVSLSFLQAGALAWQPPIGIPNPPFGINESHYMYEGKFYEHGGFYYRDAGNGPYTHYVDNSVGCTDENNEYGTVDKPRCTIPTDLPPGSVVEIHGGPYRNPLVFSWLNGTREKPIWIRGADASKKTEIRLKQNTQAIKIHDSSYIIFENLLFNGSEKNLTSSYRDAGVIEIQENSTHITFRHINITDYPQAEPCDGALGGIAVSMSSSWSPGEVNQYHVFYDITMKNYRSGEWPPDCESGGQGIVFIDGVDHIWVLNSTFENIAEDAIHIIGYHGRSDVSLKRGPHDGLPNYIYIGYNNFYREGENAIDVKESDHVFISQNTMHYFRDTRDSYGWSGGGGQAIVINDEGDSNAGGDETAKNTWILYNRIYDCNIGVSDMSGRSSYIVGNLIYDIVPTPSHYGYGIFVSKAHSTVPEAIEWIVGNTIHNFTHYGCYISNSYDAYVQNNIISELQNQSFYHLRLINIHGTKDVCNQLFYDSDDVKIYGNDCQDCIESPATPFKDKSSKDFSLYDGSYAIDNGCDSGVYGIFQSKYGLSLDYDIMGNARPQGSGWDIGAYEYVSSPQCQPDDSFIRLNSTYLQACSCSQTDVEAAIDAAHYKDTVLVPEGTCTWNQPLSITKGIALQGAGIDKTTIDIDGPSGYENAINFNADETTSANDYPFSLSGFTFRRISDFYAFMTLSNKNISSALTRVSVHDNKFVNTKEGRSIGIIHYLGVFGVIYNNIFVNVSHVWRFLGSSRGWNKVEEWIPGTGNAMYYEDNYAYLTSDSSSDLIVSGGGGNRYVARYNTINLSARGASAFTQAYDIHGNQANNPTAGIGLEIYGNQRIGASGRWIDQRGGQVFFFYNQWTNTSGSGSLNVWEEFDDDAFSPASCPSNSRYKRTPSGNCLQRVHDSYYWRNYGGMKGDTRSTVLDILFDHYDRNNHILNDPLTLFENKAWFRDTNLNFDGTIDPLGSCGYYNGPSCTKSGVGCGTLEEMYSISPKAPGIGFWATNQSCTNLAGMVGKNPENPISGTLYISAGDGKGGYKWVPYYTPYIYPHPLRVAPRDSKICKEGKISSPCWCQGMRESGYCCHGYYKNNPCETGSFCVYPADTPPCDNRISPAELIKFIKEWKRNHVSLKELIDAIRRWKNG